MVKIRKDADDKFIQQQQLSIRDQIASYQILEQETLRPIKKDGILFRNNKATKALTNFDKNLTANERILQQL